jgi:hypothetical protein
MITVETAHNAALEDIGVKAPGETLNAADLAIALARTIYTVQSWNADGLTIPCATWGSLTPTAAQAKYEFGTSGVTGAGDYATQVVRIISGFIRSGSTDYPVENIDATAYARLRTKSRSGRPEKAYYGEFKSTDTDITYLYLYPTPSSTDDYHFLAQQEHTVPSAKTDNLILPGYMTLAFVMDLAINCSAAFGYPVPPDYQMRAAQMKDQARSRAVSETVRPVPINVTSGNSRFNFMGD